MAIDLEKFKKASTTNTMPTKVPLAQNLDKFKKSASVIPETPKQDGFFTGLAKDIVRPFARAGVNLYKAGQWATGQDFVRNEPVNIPWLGATKPIGQSGNVGRDILDSAGVGTEIASTVLPVGRGIKTVAQATLGGMVKEGAKAGFVAGGASGTMYGAGRELQNEKATPLSVLGKGALGGLTGAVTGGVLGGVLPVPMGIVKGVSPQNRLNVAQDTMQRVARINPTDQVKFKQISGNDVGEFLVKNNVYGTKEEIVQKLYKESNRTKTLVDEELAKMGGEYKVAPVGTMLDTLAEREMRISSAGAPSRDLDRVLSLQQKNATTGLSMSEINEAKRIFERSARLDYIKQNLPEAVEKANTLDDAVRKWQFSQAEKLGLKNLKELNKNTQANRFLADKLWRKMSGQQANNALSLTDAVLLSGGDVSSLVMATARKAFSSDTVRSGISKKIAPKSAIVPKVVPTRSMQVPQQIAPMQIKQGMQPSANTTPEKAIVKQELSPAPEMRVLKSIKDPYTTLRAQVREGEILVKDKKGNIGALPIDEFDATVYERV